MFLKKKKKTILIRDLKSSQRCWWRLKFFGYVTRCRPVNSNRRSKRAPYLHLQGHLPVHTIFLDLFMPEGEGTTTLHFRNPTSQQGGTSQKTWVFTYFNIILPSTSRSSKWCNFTESVLTRTLYVHTNDKKTILLLASSIILCTLTIVCCMYNFKRRYISYQTPSPQARFVLWRPPHLSFLEFRTLPCARGRRVICWRPVSPAKNTHHYCSCPADCSQVSSKYNTIQANSTLSSV